MNTQIWFPNRDFEGDIALFPLGCPRGEGAVHRHLADFHLIAAPVNDPAQYVSHIFRCFLRNWREHGDCAGDLVGHFDFNHMLKRTVYSRIVLLDNSIAAFAVGFFDRFLDLFNRLFFGQNAADGEEAGLHNRINALAHVGLLGNFIGIDAVELQFLLDQGFLHLGG